MEADLHRRHYFINQNKNKGCTLLKTIKSQ